jgi:hypothetical protein
LTGLPSIFHKRQNSERRWINRTSNFHLDETGRPVYVEVIIREKSGSTIPGHFRVYDGEIPGKNRRNSGRRCKQPPIAILWKPIGKKLVYREGKDNGVIRFIAEHADRNLKAVYLGKRLYFIILEDYDKQAAKDALALSEALKNKTRLEKEIKALQSKI